MNKLYAFADRVISLGTYTSIDEDKAVGGQVHHLHHELTPRR